MTRTRLPDRRPSVTRRVVWLGQHEFAVTVGFSPHTGEPREVFATGKVGSHMDAQIADGCILISQLLQRGALARDLARSMMMTPPVSAGDNFGPVPASVLGAIVAALAGEEEG